MALVGEIVARFRAETDQYVAKIDAAKQANRALAKQFLDTAGSADKAIATLNIAKKSGEIGALGIDPRQVGGVIGQIKSLQKELDGAKDAAHATGEELLGLQAKRAAGTKDLFESFERFGRGDFLGSIRSFKKGLQDLEETKGVSGGGLSNLLGIAAIGVAGRLLAEATNKARELATEFREGKIGAGEMVERIASGIPILGNFWTIGRNIREIITGETVALEEQKRVLNELVSAHLAVKEAVKKRREEEENAGKTLAEIRQSTLTQALRNAGREGSAAAAEITRQHQSVLQAEADRINKAFDAETALRTAEIEKLTKNLEEIRSRPIRVVNQEQTASDLRARADAMAPLKEQIENAQKALDNLREKQKQQIADLQKATANAIEVDLFAKLKIKTPQQVDAENFAKGLIQKVRAGLQDNPIADWIKRQADAIAKGAAEMRQRAASLHEALKSPFEKMRDELADAVNLAGAKLLSKTDLAALFNKDIGDLTKQRESLMAQAGKHVFEVPDVKEFRGGQTLFQTPTQGLDKEQLDQLKQINDTLAKIQQSADDNGIEVNEVQ